MMNNTRYAMMVGNTVVGSGATERLARKDMAAATRTYDGHSIPTTAKLVTFDGSSTHPCWDPAVNHMALVPIPSWARGSKCVACGEVH